MTKIITKYICPYCDKCYNTYLQAKDCAENCAVIDDPIELNWCDDCHKEAIDCSCEDKDDFYKELESKIKLHEAACHPSQTKLIKN